MLSIRGADQVCTSLRAARKSLSDGGAALKPRIEELDLMIGELAVGTPSFRGDPERSKTQIEALVTRLTQAPDNGSGALPVETPDAVSGDADSRPMPAGLHDALANFRRAVATLERLMTAHEAPPQ